MLRRVEERSLYNCSATFRIPKLAVGCTQCCDTYNDKRLNVEIIEDLLDKKNPHVKERFSADVYNHFMEDHEQSTFEKKYLQIEVSFVQQYLDKLKNTQCMYAQ